VEIIDLEKIAQWILIIKEAIDAQILLYVIGSFIAFFALIRKKIGAHIRRIRNSICDKWSKHIGKILFKHWSEFKINERFDEIQSLIEMQEQKIMDMDKSLESHGDHIDMMIAEQLAVNNQLVEQMRNLHELLIKKFPEK